MKKLINIPETLVDDLLAGLLAAYSDRLRVSDKNSRVLLRADSSDRVAVVIGNGSGHEPISSGFVGSGMLSANALGDIFAAPPPETIRDAITEADNGAGVLLIISNHSGDVINGEEGAELARQAGSKVETLLVHDDISSAPKEYAEDRRGSPGIIFSMKILGSLTETGADLATVKLVGEELQSCVGTLVAALKAPISPLTGEEMFSLPDDRIYIGMGVHGEPGLAEMEIKPAREIIGFMAEKLIEDIGLQSGDRALSIVNGFGATPMMELLIVFNELKRFFAERGVGIAGTPLIGSYVTTQDMGGLSLSLCKVADEEIVRMWEAPCGAPLFHLPLP